MRVDCGDADVIIALAWGRRENSPGLSNIQIAKVLESFVDKTKIPMIVQWEIEVALLDITPLDNFDIEVVSRHLKKEGAYLDSYEVLRQAWLIMKERGWHSAVIIAHPDHWHRCKNIAQWFGVNVIDSPTIRSKRARIKYDPKTIQIWTRNKLFFKIWTMLGYVKFYLTRKKEDR